MSLIPILISCALVLAGTAYATRRFSKLLQRSEGLTTKDKVDAWEVFAKVVAVYTTIIAGFFVLAKYLDQRSMEIAARSEDAAQQVRQFNIGIYTQSKTIDDAKRILLNEAADLVATLASQDDLSSPTGKIASDRFERLYHGQLVLYEGKAVEGAMIDFRDSIQKWKRNGRKPSSLSAEERTNGKEKLEVVDGTNTDFLKQLAIRLAEACRGELEALDEKTRSVTPAK